MTNQSEHRLNQKCLSVHSDPHTANRHNKQTQQRGSNSSANEETHVTHSEFVFFKNPTKTQTRGDESEYFTIDKEGYVGSEIRYRIRRAGEVAAVASFPKVSAVVM